MHERPTVYEPIAQYYMLRCNLMLLLEMLKQISPPQKEDANINQISGLVWTVLCWANVSCTLSLNIVP